MDHLAAQGINAYGEGKYPRGVFAGDNVPRMNSGVPIRRVRMIEKSRTIRTVSDRRSTQAVEPHNNHFIEYFRDDAGRWKARVVTTWDSAVRARSEVSITPGGTGQRIMCLSIGAAFVVNLSDGPKLCVVRKIKQNGRVYYRLHTDVRPAKDLEESLSLSVGAMERGNARKVVVDVLGRIVATNR